MEPLRYAMDLACPRDGVWEAWTTADGLASWACARASVDPVIGGVWDLWGAHGGGRVGGEPALRLRLRSIDRPRLLDLSVTGCAGIAAGGPLSGLERTRLEVRLLPTPGGTRVELVQSGWGESDGWMWLRERFGGFWWSAMERLGVALRR